MQFQKTKQILATLLLSTFFISINSAYADDMAFSKAIRGKIIENFKKEQLKNIEKNNLILNDDLNLFDTQNKISVYENIKDKNTQKKEQLTFQKDIIESRVLNLEETIALLDEEIQTTTQEILQLSRNIITLSQEIESTKDEIQVMNKEIYESKKVLLKYITHIYKKQNLIYSGDDENIDGLKTVILNSDNLSDVLSDLHFSTILDATGQMLIEKYRKLVKDLFVKKLDYEEKNEELKESKKQELLKRKYQLEKKEFRTKILEFTKGKQELFEQFIQDKTEIDKKLKIKIIQNKIKLRNQKTQLLEKYQCNYIDENLLNSLWDTEIDFEEFEATQTDSNCIKLNKILTAESKLKPFLGLNFDHWPVDPKRGLSAYFQDPEYLAQVGASHDAIDIRAAQWTDIIAPADWYVTYLKEPKDEGYAYVALKHANGMITVYGHISEVMVGQYDFVKSGEVFARTGWEFGTNGAWLMTTGPHLHMEVYKNNEVQDPLEFLDLTILGDSNLPNYDLYFEKFSRDYAEKHGYQYLSDVNIIDMLRGFEWFRDTAYLDAAGIWTIGYGFTSINGKPVEEFDTMTRDEAELELVKKAAYYTNFKNFIKVPLTKEQEMALTSFEYNLGRNIWTKDTDKWWAGPIIDMINAWNIYGAAEYMKEFKSAGGKVLKGLQSRRLREADLMLQWIEDSDLIYFASQY